MKGDREGCWWMGSLTDWQWCWPSRCCLQIQQLIHCLPASVHQHPHKTSRRHYTQKITYLLIYTQLDDKHVDDKYDLLYTRPHSEGGNKHCFCLSVCPCVTYIANNSSTQRPSVTTCGRKVPHLRCDLHTSFKVKRSNVSVRRGQGHTVLSKPGGHTAC